MDNCKVRFAVATDRQNIMGFIDSHWRKGHVLARDDNLFTWQYGSDDQENLNMVLGEDSQHDIQGVLGFISYNDNDEKDIALALWKALPTAGFLGISLLLFLKQSVKYRNIFCVGINLSTTANIYRRLDLSIGTMKQWYRLREIPDYKIANISIRTIPCISGQINGKFIRFQTFPDLLSAFDYDKYVTKDMAPYKSRTYFEKRYFQHPSYQYLVYGVERDGDVRAVIVLRLQECNGAKAIRFVDCLGDYTEIAYATDGLDILLEKFDAEYIDMYETGLSDEILRKAGWLSVKESENIIPNYFSPFEQRVVDIHYCTSSPDIVLFRGDGDQDRPN